MVEEFLRTEAKKNPSQILLHEDIRLSAVLLSTEVSV